MKNATVIIFYVILMVTIFLPAYLANKKRKQQQKEMIDNFKVGDKVVTSGGILGTITNVLSETLEIKVDKNAKITVLKTSISSVEKK
ncbi:preprotein translocase subunit YajC [Leptotrichia sp. HSP-334]|uniref:Preprotein translocase subunit YajC n=1 Tax=Leptotrichia rugosa TaxID=3239302 RepID=A0AB39VGN6_9FUSO